MGTKSKREAYEQLKKLDEELKKFIDLADDNRFVDVQLDLVGPLDISDELQDFAGTVDVRTFALKALRMEMDARLREAYSAARAEAMAFLSERPER